MKIVIDIPDSIYDNIKSHGDDICDNFIISLTRVHDRSAIEVFRAIQNGKRFTYIMSVEEIIGFWREKVLL